MKIEFNDGSFIVFDPLRHDGNSMMISMCGMTENGKKAIMSSSILTKTDVEAVIKYLQEWQKSVS